MPRTRTRIHARAAPRPFGQAVRPGPPLSSGAMLRLLDRGGPAAEAALTRAGRGDRARLLVALQRTTGNGAAARLAGGGGPRAVSVSALATLAGTTAGAGAALALVTGKQPEPKAEAPPDGMAVINKRRSETGALGFTGGLTQVQSSGAFRAPAWVVQAEPQRSGEKTTWSAKVKPTTTEAPEHESWYAEKGLHERPGMGTEKDGKTCPRYWEVSGEMSRTIRQGEQEHLDDVAMAFNLTYERIAGAINELAKAPIGPAPSSDEARAMAKQRLEERLPKELGANPSLWDAKLDTLLLATLVRDQKSWHTLTNDPPREEGCSVVDPVDVTPSFAVGKHKSEELVNYKVLAP